MTEKKSIARLEMEVEDLQEERRGAEAETKKFNFGCVILVIAGLLIVAVDWFVGGGVLVVGLVWAIAIESAKSLAKTSVRRIDKEIKERRELIVAAKEAGEDYVEVPKLSKAVKESSAYKVGKLLSDRKMRFVLIAIGALIIVVIIVSVWGQ